MRSSRAHICLLPYAGRGRPFHMQSGIYGIESWSVGMVCRSDRTGKDDDYKYCQT